MKKYFLGLSGIIIALAFCAFTTPSKPLDWKDFFFDELTFAPTKGNVEDVTKWIASHEECPGDSRVACGIAGVNDKYYHLQNGIIKLNTHSYIIRY
jgi:hypothetical protein